MGTTTSPNYKALVLARWAIPLLGFFALTILVVVNLQQGSDFKADIKQQETVLVETDWDHWDDYNVYEQQGKIDRYAAHTARWHPDSPWASNSFYLMLGLILGAIVFGLGATYLFEARMRAIREGSVRPWYKITAVRAIVLLWLAGYASGLCLWLMMNAGELEFKRMLIEEHAVELATSEGWVKHPPIYQQAKIVDEAHSSYYDDSRRPNTFYKFGILIGIAFGVVTATVILTPERTAYSGQTRPQLARSRLPVEYSPYG